MKWNTGIINYFSLRTKIASLLILKLEVIISLVYLKALQT